MSFYLNLSYVETSKKQYKLIFFEKMAFQMQSAVTTAARLTYIYVSIHALLYLDLCIYTALYQYHLVTKTELLV